MDYHNIPVKTETWKRILKFVQDKEKWDETINRLLDEAEASKK